jgi:hypothetical protein
MGRKRVQGSGKSGKVNYERRERSKKKDGDFLAKAQ